MYLSNLAVVTLNGKTATRYKYFYKVKPWEKNRKVGIRGTPMIFIGYVKNHAGDCYHMYNPTTGYVTETRNIMWLHHMYYGKPKARDEVIVYLQVALTFKLEVAEELLSPWSNLMMMRKNGVMCIQD